LEFLEKALSIDPGHAFTRGQLGRAYYNLGEYDKDLELQMNYLIRVLGKESLPDLVAKYNDLGRQAAYEEVVRLVELYLEEDYFGPISMAVDYYRIEAYGKALDELEKGYAKHDPNMPYIGTGTRYEALHDSARFLAILDGMNLPHPKSRH
jgi:tetratricopeptide (TPR) repeat protein